MEFVMMTGLDGSGREEEALGCGYPVVHTEEEALTLLRSGQSAVLDAPNLRARSRKAFLERIRKLECKTRVVLVARNIETCCAALPQRREEIRAQYLAFYPPYAYEGWDEIELRYAPDAKMITPAELFFGKEGLVFLSQDNPFHKHSVGMHCIRAARITAQKKPQDAALWCASLLHDIGKAKTKAFVDSKGNPSATAHYYGHEFASAYESLFVKLPKAIREEERLRIGALISWHMMPHHFIGSEKTRERYLRLWGEDFMNDVLIIEQADRGAQN